MKPTPSVSLLVLLGLVLVGSCVSPDVEQDREKRRRLSLDMFRELINEGTLTPIDSVMGNNEFMEMEERLAQGWPGSGPDDPGASDPEALVEEPITGIDEPEEEWGDEDPAEMINPYAEFGPRILVHHDVNGEPTGLITKPYSVRPGMGANIDTLLKDYGGFALWDVAAGVQPLGTLRMDVKAGFELEQFAQNLRSGGPDEGQSIAIADWVIATADHVTLADFEYFLDVMFAGPPQIEITAKIVEIVKTEALDIGIGPVDGDTPNVGLPDNVLFDNFNWSFPNQTGGTEFITALGTVHDGAAYNLMIEALASYENIDIISRPRVAVREGTRAMIESTQRIPYYQIGSVNNSGGVNATLNYHEVGVRLYAIPRLIGGSTISLEIDVEASQQVGNEVSFITTTGEALTTPTLGFRKSNTLVYLKPGQAVILGGLVTERNVEDVKKVPLLGDIPVLGALFRSKYTRVETVSVLFLIQPRILTGTDMHRDI